MLIGDPRQIGAVGPGGLYGHLTDVIEPIVLTEIRRQRDPLDRHIVELAHEGRGSDALDLLARRASGWGSPTPCPRRSTRWSSTGTGASPPARTR